MDKKNIAYVTADLNLADPDPDLDWPIFRDACEPFSMNLKSVNWDDPTVNWREFDLAIVRSPWNYSESRAEFVNWAYRVEQQTKLLNPAKTLETNTDKTYLLKLAEQVPVIPTLYRTKEQVNQTELANLLSEKRALAIKPNIGAGASLATRVTEVGDALAAIDKIHQAGFIAMLQPYLDEVDEQGEVAIVTIAGEITHAVKKVPALTVGGHGDAHSRVEVTQEMQSYVNKLKSVIPNWDQLLYARVDVVPTNNGLLLMELELTEPTLFFEQNPIAAQLLANEILGRLSGS